MDPLTAIIFLAALLHQTDGQAFHHDKMGISSFSHFKFQNQKQILEQHNEIRRSVVPTASNMLKMVWSEEAAKNAQKWANKCGMKISPRDQRVINGVTCGENVLLSSYPKTWTEAIKVWYSQSSNFKYGFGATTKNANIENYTQLIWYNSYQVGCAVAYCSKNQFNYFYVCQYCPAGNNVMQIATPYKSGPKCADCPGHCDRGLCKITVVKYPSRTGTTLSGAVGRDDLQWSLPTSTILRQRINCVALEQSVRYRTVNLPLPSSGKLKTKCLDVRL